MEIELSAGRFYEICHLAKRMGARQVLFLAEGIAYLANEEEPEKGHHGDWAFISGDIRVGRPVAIATTELLRIHHLLGLEHETDYSMRGERIEITEQVITTLPHESFYRRTTRFAPVDERMARKLARLSFHEGDADFKLIPRPEEARRLGGAGTPVTYLTFRHAVLTMARGKKPRVAGFARVDADAVLETVPARTLYAYAQRRAASSESIVTGTIHRDRIHLWADGLTARLHASITEKRNPQWLKTK